MIDEEINTKTGNRFADLLARVLAKVEEGDLRNLIGESVERQLHNYDCQRILAAVVEPLFKEMLRDLLKEPATLDLLRERARSELGRLLTNFTVQPGRSY